MACKTRGLEKVTKLERNEPKNEPRQTSRIAKAWGKKKKGEYGQSVQEKQIPESKQMLVDKLCSIWSKSGLLLRSFSIKGNKKNGVEAGRRCSGIGVFWLVGRFFGFVMWEILEHVWVLIGMLLDRRRVWGCEEREEEDRGVVLRGYGVGGFDLGSPAGGTGLGRHKNASSTGRQEKTVRTQERYSFSQWCSDQSRQQCEESRFEGLVEAFPQPLQLAPCFVLFLAKFPWATTDSCKPLIH